MTETVEPNFISLLLHVYGICAPKAQLSALIFHLQVCVGEKELLKDTDLSLKFL